MSGRFEIDGAAYMSNAQIMALPLEAQGIFIRMVCVCAVNKALPNCQQTLHKLLGIPKQTFKKHWSLLEETLNNLLGLSEETTDKLRSLSEVFNLEKYEKTVERNRKNGKKGGRKKNPVGFQDTNPSVPKVGLPEFFEQKSPIEEIVLLNNNNNIINNNINNLEEDFKSTPPIPPKSDETQSENPKRKPRRQKNEPKELLPLTAGAIQVLNALHPLWPRHDLLDGRKVKPNRAKTGRPIDSILAAFSNVTPEILIQAAKNYIATKPQRYCASQVFFGPGKKDGTANWKDFATELVTEAALAKADQNKSPPLPPPATINDLFTQTTEAPNDPLPAGQDAGRP
jgi:hypothetical protein